MEQLTIDECRSQNKVKLLKTALWITGDGTTFPATFAGHQFAAKHARKNGLKIYHVKQITPKPTDETKGKTTTKSKRK